MIKDYHMHAQVLTLPDQIHDFVKTALDRGIEEICVTDHMPLSVSSAADRIPAGRVEEYCMRVRSLAKEYEDRIFIKLGIEIDYHPSIIDEIEAVLKAGDFDYVIGSSHLQVIPTDTFDSIHTYTDFAVAMLKNSLLAAQSGYFDTIAHLDFFKWHFTLPHRFPLSGEEFVFETQRPLVDRILNTIRDEGLRLEINSHRLAHTGDLSLVYPELWVVETALEKGLRFAYGGDAHTADHVGAYLGELRAHPVYGRAIAQWEQE